MEPEVFAEKLKRYYSPNGEQELVEDALSKVVGYFSHVQKKLTFLIGILKLIFIIEIKMKLFSLGIILL